MKSQFAKTLLSRSTLLEESMKIPIPSLLLLCISLLLLFLSADAESFDVRRHLSTVTRYEASRGSSNLDSVPSSIPDGCEAIHLNLVSRHGTREPTKRRIKELDKLSTRLETLVEQKRKNSHEIPQWIKGWESPWKGRETGGELISPGEEELYRLALRVRSRFPEIFNSDYDPHIYPIMATQVGRASASAVAFGLGMFSGKGSLGPGKHRAFSVVSESRASDTRLRFHDACETYKVHKKRQEPQVEKFKEPILDEITLALISRHGLDFTRQDIASLWFLCKQEAALLDITDQACGLFNQTEVHVLEWTDDVDQFILKGYGASINYRMGVPLLNDSLHSMQQAIIRKQENQQGSTFERARLRFAHAETIVPFGCLLGLFLEGSEFEKIQREEPLSWPAKPPQKRKWKGSFVAPFAANNMLVLYQCTTKGDSNSSYHVQVLHNEVPVPLPACGNKDFCPFEVFKEKVVDPHLKHDFNSICSIKKAVQEAIVEVVPPCSPMCKLLNFVSSFFSSGQSQRKDAEL